MTTGNDVRDYRSFVEQIQNATDYVREVLTENARLERRTAELEKENRTLRAQRTTLRQLVKRDQEEDRRLHRELEELRQKLRPRPEMPQAA